jgi:predicted O-methyltransferase YrrM
VSKELGMRLRDLPRLRDRGRLWQRLSLYSKVLVPRIPWQEVGDFPRLWPESSKRTLVDEARAQTLYQLARHASRLEGAMAEIGVYRGGTANLLACVADGAGRTLHLFDTFAGMPETDVKRDLLGAGDFADTSLDQVKRFLRAYKSPDFHQGEFPSTAKGLEGERFSLVHCDADIASSVEACCEFFYPRLVPGGVIVFDDYGFTSTPGAKTASDAFFADKPEPLLHLVTSQAIAFKT